MIVKAIMEEAAVEEAAVEEAACHTLHPA